MNEKRKISSTNLKAVDTFFPRVNFFPFWRTGAIFLGEMCDTQMTSLSSLFFPPLWSFDMWR